MHTENVCLPELNSTLKAKKIINIKCGLTHSVAQSEENEWYLWGDNEFNQCLVYDNDSVLYPTKYDGRDLNENEIIVEIYVGYQETKVVVVSRVSELNT